MVHEFILVLALYQLSTKHGKGKYGSLVKRHPALERLAKTLTVESEKVPPPDTSSAIQPP